VTIAITTLSASQLREVEDLSKEAFGFTDRELVPAAHLHTVGQHGGINIGAISDRRVVGYVHAFPGHAPCGEPLYYVTNVCVAPEAHGRGIATSLMRAVRAEAYDRGAGLLKWTTNIMSVRNLYLYLTKCGAHLVAVRHLLYKGLLPTHGETGADGDEAEFHWSAGHGPLKAPSSGSSVPPDVPPVLSITEATASARRMRETSEPYDADRYAIAMPLDPAAQLPPQDLTHARRALREAAGRLLAQGFVGTEVRLERARGTAFLCFSRLHSGQQA
jgi:predicted GNAT superfamily acetyltransferase